MTDISNKPFITIIPAPLASAIWFDILEPLFLDPVSKAQGEFTMEQLREYVSSGRMLVLAVIVDGALLAACAVESVTYPNKKTLRVSLLSGEGMNLWLGDLVEQLDQLAENWGADDIEVVGRVGWTKVLGEHGYDQSYAVLHKQRTER